MKDGMKKGAGIPGVVLLLAAAMPTLAATPAEITATCEKNFAVDGSFGGGRSYTTEAQVPGVAYLPALYRVRDKIQEQGLDVLVVQEKNGFIRAANPVKGGEGGGANAPLRVFVTPLQGDDGGVNVSIQFTIAGGQSTNKKTVMKYLCEMAAAAAN